MGNNKNVIELNGKVYDALSGALLQVGGAAKQGAQKTGKAIDSVVSRVPKPKTTPKASASARHINSKRAHSQEPSKTLMRSSVKKPSKNSKTKHAQASISSLTTKVATVLPPAARASIHERRLARSKQVSKSSAIRRFNPIDITKKQLAALPVKQPTDKKSIPTQGAKHHTATKPASRIQKEVAVGLAKATSHQQKPLAKKQVKRKMSRKRRALIELVSIIVGVVILLGLAGTLLYRNLPSIELHLASSRSGVKAEMPSYKPSDFKATTPVKYAPGIVTINFKSSSGKEFSLVQQNSDWDSQTLKATFLTTSHPAYQTLEANGRTIYVYDKGSATWVNGGIWYQLSGSADLSNSQIINIATSL